MRLIVDGRPERILHESDMDDYQLFMSDKIVGQNKSYLAAEMGLGKTGASIHAIWRMKLQGRLQRKRSVLVVAPLEVARNTWPEELLKWSFAEGLTFTVLTGDTKDREYGVTLETDIHIINRENIVWLWKHLGARNWPYRILIYDEASRLKSGDKKSASTVSKTRRDEKGRPIVTGGNLNEFGTLCRARGLFDTVIELSGTPSPNGLRDLWGPFYILDRGEALGTSKAAFDARWFTYNSFTYEHKPQPHAFEEITDRIRPLMVGLRTEDYIKLPPLVPVIEKVTLPDTVMAKYKEMEATYYLEEHDIEAVNSGVLCNKLLQLSNGSIYDEEGNDIEIHDLKLKALERIVENTAGRPLLIAYSFEFDKKRILKRFPHFRVFGESPTDKKDWDSGKIPGMLMHPASASHGLNFQFGGNIAVWYGLNWSLELWLQFNFRLKRRGQRADKVWLYLILAEGTYDYRQYDSLNRKDATQERITNTVRMRPEDLKRLGYGTGRAWGID